MLKTLRKLIIFIVLAAAFVIFVFKMSLPFFAGASKFHPKILQYQLSSYAQNLIDEAYEGIEKPADYHVHLLGEDASRDTYVHPKFREYTQPYQKARFDVFAHASQIKTFDHALEEYTQRLISQAQHMPKTKFYIFAFEAYHDDQGVEDLKQSDFYIGNEIPIRLSEKYPDYLEPVISIHPKRNDALKELKKYHKKGVKYIKWLPNAMNIDPQDPAYIPFYKAVKEYNMSLIVHVGIEHAVTSVHQDYGNPLIYKKPLDLGINIIMAHAATLGQCSDLESSTKPQVPCFDLFMRLMDDPKYIKNLYSDVSSIYLFNRNLDYVKTLIRREDLHPRFLNGSDYPLVAINYMIHLKKIENAGLITKNERLALKEIYQYNPLLFDFVLKRTLRDPDTQKRFSNIVFEERDLF